MHRIDVPSATPENLFTEGSPTGGVAATTLAASWLNDLQENVCAVVEGAGLTLTKGRLLDLLDAINALVAGTSQSLLQANNGYKLHADGYFEVWGVVSSASEPISVVFDHEFGELFGVNLQCASPVTPTTATSFNVQATTAGFTVTRNDGTTVEPFYWKAWGRRTTPIV